MADYIADRAIYLSGFSGPTNGSGATWNSAFDQQQASTVRDLSGDGFGALTLDDWMNNSSIKFTGYYVEIGGQHYGIFQFGSFGFIPYNSALTGGQLDLGGQRGTTLHTDALETAANCFLTGTRIATPAGQRPIEVLGPGDRVLTADGEAVAVLWVWRQEIVTLFGLGERRAPIRIAAGALGPGCPARDLVLSADHAVVLGGHLVNAGALVNGGTIAVLPLSRMPARFTYWHVETEAHVALMAENCPAESFIDYTPRAVFDNVEAYRAQGGTDRPIAEMPLPRIIAQRQLLPGLRQRLGLVGAA